MCDYNTCFMERSISLAHSLMVQVRDFHESKMFRRSWQRLQRSTLRRGKTSWPRLALTLILIIVNIIISMIISNITITILVIHIIIVIIRASIRVFGKRCQFCFKL